MQQSYNMLKINWFRIALVSICLALASNTAFAKVDAVEQQKMESFHLKNAANKVAKQQYSYAWGDLAYVVCQIPNHHAALKQMVQIAPHIHKTAELSKFFVKALSLYPKDEVVLALYGSFLLNNGQSQQGQKLITQALAINPNIDQDFLPEAESSVK